MQADTKKRKVTLLLYVRKTLQEPLCQFMKMLHLPKPELCDSIEDLPEIYNKSMPVVLISTLSLSQDKLIGKLIGEVIQKDIRSKLIVIPDNIFYEDTPTQQKFSKAVAFCLENPERIMRSLCLAGVSFSAFYQNEAMKNTGKPMLGITKIKGIEEIENGHVYFLIMQDHSQLTKRLYMEENGDFLIFEPDSKLTPDSDACYMMERKNFGEIMAVFKVDSEAWEF